ncbi:CvpA family protein [Patescibacteria group bacterium]
MNIVDTTLLILLGGFVLAGFWFGVIHMLGSMLGVILGTLIAGQFYDSLSAWLAGFLHINPNLLSIVSFMLLFSLTVRLIGLLVNFVDKAISIISIIPFLKLFDRLLGAAFGLLEGALALGLAVHFAGKFPFSAEFTVMLQESVVAGALSLVGALLIPLLPKAWRAMQSFI